MTLMMAATEAGGVCEDVSELWCLERGGRPVLRELWSRPASGGGPTDTWPGRPGSLAVASEQHAFVPGTTSLWLVPGTLPGPEPCHAGERPIRSAAHRAVWPATERPVRAAASRAIWPGANRSVRTTTAWSLRPAVRASLWAASWSLRAAAIWPVPVRSARASLWPGWWPVWSAASGRQPVRRLTATLVRRGVHRYASPGEPAEAIWLEDRAAGHRRPRPSPLHRYLHLRGDAVRRRSTGAPRNMGR